MKQISKLIILLVVLFTSCGKSWDYQHQDQWSKKFPDCAGKYQSPVDLKNAVGSPDLKPLLTEYQATDSVVIKNTGKTIKLSHLKGSIVTPDTASYTGHEYYLSNIHFHTPSEHTVDGKHYPAEIHFVHIDTAGNIMVLGVFITDGMENPAIEQILDNVKEKEHTEVLLKEKFDPNELLPESVFYWHYTGSLTTPPCTEGVQWYILKQPIEASSAQLNKLAELMGKNNRKVQALNGRKITEF